MGAIKPLFVVSALAALVGSSRADAIFDQIGGTFTPDGYAFSSQRYDSPLQQYDIIAIDDFSVGEASKLSSFTFGLAGTDQFAVQNVHGYEFNIFSGGDDLPVVSLTGDVLHAELGTAFATVGQAGFGVGPYTYKVTLDLSSLDFTLEAGHYWIGVTPQLDSSFGETGVLGSLLSDADSDPLNARKMNPSGGWHFPGDTAEITNGLGDHVNLAYRLDAQPVPEPASLAALTLGTLAFIRRRSKQ